MRVIAGKYRSRVLSAPPGSGTRPTSDRLRETLFNVLGERVVNARFADLYAGSGAVGLEALSRGAAAVTLIERAGPALAAIRRNVVSLGLEREVTVETRPVRRVLEDWLRKANSWDLVFIDPPYESAEEYTASLRLLGEHAALLLTSGALVIAEHASRSPLPESYGALTRTRLLQQGDASLSFYAPPLAVAP